MGERLVPATAAELRDAVAWAAAEDVQLEVVGHGSKRGLGRPVQAASPLDLSRLQGIVAYEPEELVLSARTGTPLAEVETLLAGRRQMLAFEPPDFAPLWGGLPGAGSLGGAIACNLAGPRRIMAGAARDHVLGFSAVSGRGEAFKAGGRVVKNVTGYDLCKLMAGSFGTLAVMDEVTLKVLPAPETARTVLLFGLDPEAATAALAEALGSTCDVSGAAHLPGAAASRSGVDDVRRAGASVTAVRVEGTAVSVAARTESLRLLLADRGRAASELHTTPSRLFWREVRDVLPLLPGDALALWRVSVPPGAGAGVAAVVAGEHFFDWGGGLVWIAVEASLGPGAPGEDFGAGALRAAIASSGGPWGGHATLMRAPEPVRASVPVFEPLAPALAALTRRVKLGFDPNRILNPGRMYPGI